MKIAVSSTGKDLNAEIDPRFGRCAYFILADTDTMAFEAFDNANLALGGGAGIQSAQFVASEGAQAVITGNCGPNAVRTLTAAGVKVIVGQSGSVKSALERFKAGSLNTTTEPNVADHYGMGGGTDPAGAPSPSVGTGMGRGGGGMGGGMGRGGGMGGGMGRGGGMGCRRTGGQGMGGGWGGAPSAPLASDPSLSGEQDVATLKNQISELQAQIEGLKAKIEEKDEK